MSIHPNSIVAFHEFDHDGREAQIIRAFWNLSAPASDRDILEILGYVDMNSVRPAITKLTDLGVLAEIGSRKCPVTKRDVRVSMISANPLVKRTKMPQSIKMTPDIRSSLEILAVRHPHATYPQIVAWALNRMIDTDEPPTQTKEANQ